jgi:hypothetical protein
VVAPFARIASTIGKTAAANALAADPQYPMLARSLRSRVDNLQKTTSKLKAAD